MWDLPQWSTADAFNSHVWGASGCASPRYLLLVTRTSGFRVDQDIRSLLKITKQPNRWFFERFRALGVRVEYATAFTDAQKKRLGPLSERVSSELSKCRIQELFSDPVLVCGHKDFKDDSRFEVITPESFAEQLLQRS